MNTDITASTKPEYPVIDRNPSFTKVVGNFNSIDYFSFFTITGYYVTIGIKPGIRGPTMVTSMAAYGLLGLIPGFAFAYTGSEGRLMGILPNEGEVARYKK